MAVQTPEFLFIHVPKTGGVTMTDLFLRYCAGAARINAGWDSYHEPRSAFSPEGRKVVSNVRDPWTWYASWYFHSKKRDAPWLIEYGQGLTDFRSVLYGVTHPGKVGLAKLGGYWPDVEGEVDVWKARGEGLCSYVFRYMWGGEVDALIPTDRLKEGMEKLLNSPLMVVKMNDNKDGGNYRPLYNDEMIRWVAAADPVVISTFEFSPFSASKQPMWRSVALGG